MRDKPLVSIIMGVYNCEDCLKNSVNSVLGQTYSCWELIICDDCSTDQTYNIAQQFAMEHDNIIVLKNERNMKLAYTLNRCLEKAKGKYVARMDADDICLDYRLEKQVMFLEAHTEYAVVGGGVIPYDEVAEKKERLAGEIPTKMDLIHGVPFFHPTIMMRKSAYDDLRGYVVEKRTIKGQDLDLWFRFFAKGYKGYNLQMPVLKYHESVSDYKKKRTFKAAWGMTQTRLLGFKLNRVPIYLYPFALKPIVSVMLPRSFMYRLHNKKS